MSPDSTAPDLSETPTASWMPIGARAVAPAMAPPDTACALALTTSASALAVTSTCGACSRAPSFTVVVVVARRAAVPMFRTAVVSALEPSPAELT